MDLGGVGGAAASVFTGLVAVLGGLATWRKAKSESASTASRDIEDRFDRQEERIAKLDKRTNEMEVRERILIQYIFTLQLHIVAGKPPPPPPWPPELLQMASSTPFS